MSAKDTLGNAPGLKEHEAKQNRVAHSSPNRPDGIAACCDALNEHRVNCNTYEDQQPLKAHGKQGLDIVLPGAAKLPVGKRSNGDGGQTGQQKGKNPAPYHITMAGFRELPSEPDLHLSAYPALQMSV